MRCRRAPGRSPRRRRRPQRAPAGQHAGDRRGHRLGDGHQQVRDVGCHAVEVVLGHDLALVQHQEAVGVCLVQHLGHGQLAVPVAEPEAEEVAFRARQRAGAAGARDPGRRDELPDVLEGPPVERRVLPVRERHQRLLRERGYAGHQRGGVGRRVGWSSHGKRSSYRGSRRPLYRHRPGPGACATGPAASVIAAILHECLWADQSVARHETDTLERNPSALKPEFRA